MGEQAGLQPFSSPLLFREATQDCTRGPAMPRRSYISSSTIAHLLNVICLLSFCNQCLSEQVYSDGGAENLDELLKCVEKGKLDCVIDQDMARRLSTIMMHICSSGRHSGLQSCGDVQGMKRARASSQPRLQPLAFPVKLNSPQASIARLGQSTSQVV